MKNFTFIKYLTHNKGGGGVICLAWEMPVKILNKNKWCVVLKINNNEIFHTALNIFSKLFRIHENH